MIDVIGLNLLTFGFTKWMVDEQRIRPVRFKAPDHQTLGRLRTLKSWMYQSYFVLFSALESTTAILQKYKLLPSRGSCSWALEGWPNNTAGYYVSVCWWLVRPYLEATGATSLAWAVTYMSFWTLARSYWLSFALREGCIYSTVSCIWWKPNKEVKNIPNMSILTFLPLLSPLN